MKKILVLLFLLYSLSCLAATTNVTGTVTGADGQVWANGTYTIEFRPAFNNPTPASKYTNDGVSFTQLYTGSLDATGSFTVNGVADNNTVEPALSQWTFTVCPLASFQCATTSITITGANQNVSTQLNAVAPNILITALGVPKTYKDNEVNTPAGVGSIYYNVINHVLEVYDGNFIPINGQAYDIRFFGGLTSASDNSAALNAAITASCLAGGKTIFFPVGQWNFTTAPNSIGCGSWIVGEGNGSNNLGGTALVANYNEVTATNGFLTWDGSYLSNLGTGGGLENLTIYKGSGKTGGTTIKLTGSDDNHRAGFFTIKDVVTSFISGGTWNKNLLVDGSCCTTPGSQGIRDITIGGFWAAGATDGDSAVDIINSVQFVWNSGMIFSGTPNPGITLTGTGAGAAATTNAFIANLYVIGNYVLDFCTSCLITNSFIGTNFSASVNTGGCMLWAQIGGTITNTPPCLLVSTNSNGSLLGTLKLTGGLRFSNTLLSNTAPTIGSGFGTSASLLFTNGTGSFQINVGTGGTATNGVLSMPVAANGWSCSFVDITTQSSTVFMTKQIAYTTTSVTLANFNTAGAQAAWVASDKLNAICTAF